MTGWFTGATQPLSRQTAASPADPGHAADLEAADPFDIPSAGLRAEGGPPALFPGDDVVRGPGVTRDERGREVPAR